MYFDYNATCPLSKFVIDGFRSGELLFENPSSIHTAGKRANLAFREVKKYLFSLFDLDSSQYQIIFHSGATEFINTLVKGMSIQAKFNGQNFSFYAPLSSHACVLNQKQFLLSQNHTCHYFNTDKADSWKELDFSIFDNDNHNDHNSLVNINWVNNETGIIFDFCQLDKIIGKSFIHVDASQAIGKIDDWRKLNPDVDIFTFSGHKFGALKGVGFSIIKKHILQNKIIYPLLNGGHQQILRPGTLNMSGICSLKLALQDIVKNSLNLCDLKQSFENRLKEVFGRHVIIVGDSEKRAFNTSCFILENNSDRSLSIDSDELFILCDINKIYISKGSACSAGLSAPSDTLMAMGYSEEQSQNNIRISLPILNHYSEDKIKKSLNQILSFMV